MIKLSLHTLKQHQQQNSGSTAVEGQKVDPGDIFRRGGQWYRYVKEVDAYTDEGESGLGSSSRAAVQTEVAFSDFRRPRAVFGTRINVVGAIAIFGQASGRPSPAAPTVKTDQDASDRRAAEYRKQARLKRRHLDAADRLRSAAEGGRQCREPAPVQRVTTAPRELAAEEMLS